MEALKLRDYDAKNYMKFVMDFHKQMLINDLTLVYEGLVTQEITKAFTSLAERDLDRMEDDGKVKKKVYHVMVECLQNIAKHADEEGPSASDSLEDGLVKSGIFIVGKGEDSYFVTSGNSIENDKVEPVSQMLDHINSLDKDGLKKLYKEKMLASKISEKGGAGLGFIDMAKKTGNKLVYHFEKINEHHSFFLLRTQVTRAQDAV